MPKRALIFGIPGQDGAYLARLLLEKGTEVHGTSRDAQLNSFKNLQHLGILDNVTVESASPTDFRSVLEVISSTKPDEVYNLAGQSSVGLSFDQPAEALQSIALGSMNILEAIRFTGRNIKAHVALSPRERGSDSGRAGAQVETVSIDEFLAGHRAPNMIKIDVEAPKTASWPARPVCWRRAMHLFY